MLLLVTYANDALRVHPHETAEVFGVGSLAGGFAAFIWSEGAWRRVAREGTGWEKNEADIEKDVARLMVEKTAEDGEVLPMETNEDILTPSHFDIAWDDNLY